MLLVQTHPVKELVIIYVEGGGVKAILDWILGGGLNFFIKKFRAILDWILGGAKLFYKEVWGVSQLIARYIQDRGSLAKMGRAVKQ